MSPKALMTIDDYIVLADIPRISLEPEEDLPDSRRRTQSPSPRRDHRTRTPGWAIAGYSAGRCRHTLFIVRSCLRLRGRSEYIYKLLYCMLQ